MSLSHNNKLKMIAKLTARSLRKNSTEAEKIFWEAVRNRKLLNLKFYRQHPLFYDLTGKETFYVADFYCHKLKLVIEIDGGYHSTQQEHDLLRTQIINYLNIAVVRFTNKEITEQLPHVMSVIERIASGELNPQSPFS
jgi:very-short-patch-repair endonuclease